MGAMMAVSASGGSHARSAVAAFVFTLVAATVMLINYNEELPVVLEGSHPVTEIAGGMVEDGVHMVPIYPHRKRINTHREVMELGLEQIDAEVSDTEVTDIEPVDHLHEDALADRGNMQYFGHIQIGTPP